MPTNETFKLRPLGKNVYLRVSKGHFATGHSHTNYYIDVTTQKTRLSEAQAVAGELMTSYRSSTVIDTILCLDGTEVIGTCLAEALTAADFISINAHQTIYVLTPEHTTGSQLIFRDNTAPMIAGKHVLVLAASVTTGYTAASAIEAVRYYGGEVVGVSAIFATVDRCVGIPVTSVFNPTDLPDYASFPAGECPLCRGGQRLQALINSYGFSKL